MTSSKKNFLIALCIIITLTIFIFIIKKFNDINNINNDQIIIEDYLKSQTEKLPIKIDQHTNLIDVSFNKNRLTFVYLTTLNITPGVDTSHLKTYFLTGKKKEEICNTINNSFKTEIKFEYLYINKNKDPLFSMIFDKKDCY